MSGAALPLAAEEFLSWLAVERGRSTNTLAAYRRDLAAYVTWLDGDGRSLEDVSEPDVERYVAQLRSEGRAPASVARALVSVRTLHRFLADEGRLAGDPAAFVAPPKVPQGLPKPLTEDEVRSLLGAVVGDEPAVRRDRALLELLYGTGARISEACRSLPRRPRPRCQPRAPVRQGLQGAGRPGGEVRPGGTRRVAGARGS